jgi:alkylresorcinol/alkylpyrone synthase
VATALPPHAIGQAEAREEARKAFADLPDIDRLVRLFDGSGVENRYLAFPKEYYLNPKSFGRRNDDYIQIGLELGERAVTSALEQAGLSPRDLDALLFTTTTGLSTPSIDALLVERMGMSPGIRRIPLFGLGCAGGAGALSLAADFLRLRPDAVAAVLSVELCSLTLRLERITKVNLVGSALFSDGVACAVLAGSRRAKNGVAILEAETALFPDTSDFMGWNFSENGFELVLSPHVPGFIAESFPPRAKAFLERQGLSAGDVNHFALHPGGRRVIHAYRRGLGLSSEDLEPTRESLRRYGNLSSASVFFSLNEVLKQRDPQPGELGFMAAMGPGFAAEMLLLLW